MIEPYYQDKWVTIYHGDCREIMPDVDTRVDLVLTDPPYGIGKANWDENYPRWCIDLAFSISSRIAIMPGLWALPLCLQDMGDRYKWILAGHNLNALVFGAIGCNNWIPCVVGGNIPRNGQDAFDFSIVGDMPNHPSPKPYRFICWLIERLSNPYDLVLDPFLGSGTTCCCAKKLNRYSIGIEIEEKYCEIAARRCCQEVMELV